MTFEQIITSIKNKDYKPIYFLMGEEAWYIDEISNLIARSVLTEEEKGFNQTIMYGKDTTTTDVIMAARRYPMMSQYQVVIVKEAQNLSDIDKLELYADKPLKSTILVLCYKYKTLDKRKKAYKMLEQNGIMFHAKKLYDNQVPSWINSYLKGKGMTIDPKASVLISDFLGSELSKISHELDKLSIALGSGVKHILPEHVENNIGISKDYNNFELQKAVMTKDHNKANSIIFAFGKNSKANPIQVTISTLFGFFIKLLMFHYLPDKSQANVAKVLKINPYFVQDYTLGVRNYNARKVVDAISLLREYDMKSKGFNSPTTDVEQLLKELIFKLMH
ncbi:MAG: DNA polymerase III subunit delta [Marinilabiliaceae bacterium]|nr:DNA polymerase III subunit delta [Marinilabiliaceae bacterium]